MAILEQQTSIAVVRAQQNPSANFAQDIACHGRKAGHCHSGKLHLLPFEEAEPLAVQGSQVTVTDSQDQASDAPFHKPATTEALNDTARERDH